MAFAARTGALVEELVEALTGSSAQVINPSDLRRQVEQTDIPRRTLEVSIALAMLRCVPSNRTPTFGRISLTSKITWKDLKSASALTTETAWPMP